MDIRAMNVARSYDTARSATEPQPGTGTGAALTHAIGDFATTFREGEATARAAMIGGARTIKIHGEYIPVEAEVDNLTMLSAHADSDELMRWLGSLHEAPRHVYVTHGEPTGAQVLAKRVSEELGWACSVPALGSWGMLA